jgi:hypothetical protein
MNKPRHSSHSPITRREMIRVGAIGLLGLGMNHVEALHAMNAGVSRNAKAKRVIYIFLSGGLAQHESFDMKPDAAVEYRGEFKPIATRTPAFLHRGCAQGILEPAGQISVIPRNPGSDMAHEVVPHLGGHDRRARTSPAPPAPSPWPSPWHPHRSVAASRRRSWRTWPPTATSRSACLIMLGLALGGGSIHSVAPACNEHHRSGSALQ